MREAQADRVRASCWNCQAETGGGHFCPGCGKIQPLPRGTDYFAFFGLPQKLGIDSGELEKRFHELSWRLHPDNFVQAGESERGLSLERSSELNGAYRTLREPVRRVEYLLLLHGVRKEGQTKQQAPAELLEEVFELNERLDELRAARGSGNGSEAAGLREKLEASQRSFEEKLGQVDAELEGLFADWDATLKAGGESASAAEARRKLMAKMNEALNRRSYIRNLVASVQKELTEA